MPSPASLRVAVADAAGMVVLDHVAMPPPGVFFQLFGFHLPFQALYRDTPAGPCGARWNATNAVLLPIDPL